jgi:hypothetical protein
MTKARSRGDSSPDGENDDRARRPAASRQLERDPAAEGVPDQRWRVQAEVVQLRLDRISQPGWGWSAIGKRQAFAEAGEIDRDHVMAVLKGVEHWLPGTPTEPEPVHEDQRLSAATAVARQRRRAGGVAASATCYRQGLTFAGGHRLLSSVVVLAR